MREMLKKRNDNYQYIKQFEEHGLKGRLSEKLNYKRVQKMMEKRWRLLCFVSEFLSR